MPHWTVRDISREAAAAALRMPAATLDVWLHRYRTPSGKRGKNRVFSWRDIVVLQTARALLGPDILAADAITIADRTIPPYPPDPDAVLIVTASDAWLQHRDDDWPEENMRLVPVGQFAQTLGGARVAVHK